MKDKRQEFARRLNLLLENQGMNQTDLANKLDVSRTLINKYCNAARLPSLKVIQKIASYFGVTADYLLDIEGDIEITPEKNLVPILNEVRAGMPELISDETVIGYERVSDDLSIKGELFALKVKGDSMYPRFVNGDIVIVKRQNYAETGDIAIVLVGKDEATLKLYKRTHNGISLIPFNEDYPELKYSNDDIVKLPITILGIVVELRARNFLGK